MPSLPDDQNQTDVPGDNTDVSNYHHLLRRLRTDPADTVWYLVSEVGPRSATSLEEAQTAAFLAGRFRRAGLQVSVDPFASPTSVGWDGIVLGLFGLSAVIIFYWWPIVSLGVIVLCLTFAVWRLFRLAKPFIVQQRISQNVIGTRVMSQSPVWRVVLTAPLDAPPVIDRPFRRFVQGYRPFMGRVIACIVVLLLMIVYLIYVDPVWWYAQIPFITYILFLTAIDGYTLFAPTSPGAVSHAGATAVLLSSAEMLTDTEHVELWFVGLGATTTGTGINDLLERYPFEFDRTLFISLEGIGHGELSYITQEGFMQNCAADHFILDIAAKADSADPFIDIEPRLFYDGLTHGGVLRRLGWRVLTITCLNDSGHVPHYASMSDKSHIVDTMILDRAVRMVVACVRQIDSIKTSDDVHS
ncbi:MAG: hypothetical protein GFH27_549307n122 [Chloroflexi bacterium AL-W]|nr:hypothetical protein [Chloroflexi bacterium AL-N1]NOK69154.1 hypothetical protein [Chloroflexi bacterium AL-N10]NOK77137.1 hypothetical protein [Chloroflexi bacterium AL-N5]NOK83782.1 hypothetical protein [Chloroflexi bacterium AL-W]NOK90992.1 hypothetical protein [Chloroflexi bacterium AL-N15]